tara:strand:- start:954 stop:1220 length:267 start_codon:yes stop_codon:yes gene_type:complete
MPPRLVISDDALDEAVKRVSKNDSKRTVLISIFTCTFSIVGTVVGCTAWAVRQFDQIWTVRQEAESWRQVVKENPTIHAPDIYAIHDK